MILVPLVEGRVSGWPGWSWLFRLAVPAAAALVAWELGWTRGGEPVIQVGLLREHRAFGIGQAPALLYFAGFTSLFFTLSILLQEASGRCGHRRGGGGQRPDFWALTGPLLLAGLGNGLVIAPNPKLRPGLGAGGESGHRRQASAIPPD